MWKRLVKFLTSPIFADDKERILRARLNEERYRLITSVISDYVFSTQFGENGEIQNQWLGGAFEKITGYTPEEYFARGGWRTILHPDDKEQDERDMAHLLANQRAVSEIRIIRKDGSVRWVRAYGHPLWDDQRRRLTGIYGVVQDINAPKQIETDLRQREAILESVTFAAEQLLKTRDWRLQIDSILERLGKTIHATHAYLFGLQVNSRGEQVCSMRNEWTARGYSSDLENPEFQNSPVGEKGFERYYETMQNGEPFFGNTSSFSPIEGKYFNSFGVKAILEVPLFVDGQWWGTIGFDDFEREREWSSAEVDALKIASGILSGAIQREKANEALHESEEQFRQLAENIEDVVWINNAQHTGLVYVNPSYERVWGRSVAELLQDNPSYMRAVYPQDREKVAAVFRLSPEERIGEQEFRIVRPDGSVRWIRDRAFAIRDQHGNMLRIAGIAEDITERKQSQEALQQAETKYRGLVEQLPIIVYINPVSDLNSTIYVSPQVKTFLGYSQDEWLEDPIFWRKVLYSEDRQRVMAEVERANQSRELLDVEYRMVARDGSLLWFRDQATLIHDSNHRPLLRQGLMINITERKHAEDALRESEVRLNDAQRLAKTGSWTWELPSHLTWSKNMFALFGIEGDTPPNFERFLKRLVEEDRTRVMNGFRAFLASTRTHQELEYRVIGSHGEPRIIQATEYVERDGNGVAIRVVGTVQDITERKQAEHERENLIVELKAKNAELERFTYTVSHDLKSPLVTINGFLGYLEQDAASGNMERLKKDTRRIQEAVYKMQRLLNELLELSRIGRMMNAPENIPFDELVREALDIVQGQLEE
ncbi:MAG: PAS domain-containing protein, partial [Anaerolineales bacterium]